MLADCLSQKGAKMIDLLIAAAVGFVFGALFRVFLIAALVYVDDHRKTRRKDNNDS